MTAQSGPSNSAQRSIDDWAPGGSAAKESISGIVRLPGMWEAGSECLDLKPTGFCDEGHIQLGSESSCGTRRCPLHWYLWRRGAAEKVVARLAAYRYVQDGIGRRMLHVVGSPPQDQRWMLDDFWDVRGESYDLVEEHGGRGGACIPHAFKMTDGAKGIFETAVEEGNWDPEKGIWRFFREFTDGWEDLESFVEVAPHVHQLVPWEDLDGEEIRDELPEGWVIHNVRSLAPFYLFEEEVPGFLLVDEDGRPERSQLDVVREGFEDMARLVMYLLSHAAVQPSVGEEIPGRNTVTYWGDVHPNSFDPEEELEAEEWERIQRYAAEAVGGEYVPEEAEGVVEEGQTCSIGDCEAEVHGLHELGDYLAQPSWVESLEWGQACEVWGLKVWMNMGLSPGGEMDRPPPNGFERSASKDAKDERGFRDPESLREWLRRLGRSRIHQNPWYDMREFDVPEGYESA